MYINFGIFEILTITAIGAVIIGPKKLPIIGKKLGKVVSQVDKETASLRNEVNDLKKIVTLNTEKESD